MNVGSYHRDGRPWQQCIHLPVDFYMLYSAGTISLFWKVLKYRERSCSIRECVCPWTKPFLLRAALAHDNVGRNFLHDRCKSQSSVTLGGCSALCLGNFRADDGQVRCLVYWILGRSWDNWPIAKPRPLSVTVHHFDRLSESPMTGVISSKTCLCKNILIWAGMACYPKYFAYVFVIL